MRLAVLIPAAVAIAVAHTRAAEPTIQLAGDGSTRDPYRIEIVGFNSDQMATIRERAAGVDWHQFFIVRLKSAGQSGASPMWGKYDVAEERIIFHPRFSLTPGQSYLAHFNAKDKFRPYVTALLWQELVIPRAGETLPPRVASIAPSADRLPENLLKFYIHFSQPMARGEAYEHLRLADSNRRVIDDPFLELGEELWDPSGRRFTLLFDPGRIKRGVKPNEEAGAPLVAGNQYLLVVVAGWRDATGKELSRSVEHGFTVVAADHEQPSIERWTIHPPAASTREPLVVNFDEPLDEGMLADSIGVVDSAGTLLPGKIRIRGQEKRWEFTPQSPWGSGGHRLIAANTLEDLAGNSLGRAFEERVEGKEPKTADRETYEREFRINE